MTDLLRAIRPVLPPPFELRCETPPGQQAQVDFAQFQAEFTDEPGIMRIVWLFSLVLGHSRMMWGRFGLHQDLPTVLRCHIAAFEALGGVPQQILYDRMKTAVICDDAEAGHITTSRAITASCPRRAARIAPRPRMKLNSPYCSFVDPVFVTLFCAQRVALLLLQIRSQATLCWV